MKKLFLSCSVLFLIVTVNKAQFNGRPPTQRKLNPIVQKMFDEEMNNSQLKQIAHELFDKIGPRLVGTPKMQQANDWAVAKYQSWGIDARNEKWGEWRGWERGVSHIDMISPWVKTLAGTQLAWCPSTKGKTITADVIILPELADSAAYAAWFTNAKGKYVMISMQQPTGRPDADWKQYGTEESIKKMNHERDSLTRAWAKRMSKTGYNTRTLPVALEKAGAAGIITNYWSKEYGADKIFAAYTKTIPTVDISLEDYGLIYRLVESGSPVKLNIRTDSRETGVQPTFNTVGEIKGTEKPNEYILLSAHFDSWDGGTGATDNGTGTLVMMEAMRLLKQFYPNPKRTILVGHWGSEEEGLNGSKAFAEDHPEIMKGLQASFNQDNGTGRIESISGQGFLHAYEYLQRWLDAVPYDAKKDIKTTFPGSPASGGTDNASFVAAGAPAFGLGSLSWGYFNNTWHTNLDTYDKVVFDDVQKNAILTAVLVYMASEDPSFFNREKAVLPVSPFTGQPGKWPPVTSPTRKGGLD
ncbi:MAG: M20/M25/M40 family metallo-hydrolase [Bacteroidetes bacterium]|nr:M20/M25/M40 family metallo-hydrolase [Bacteroidota bacterium]MBS1671133.1 M20/M25/M40 family metallo-hydrolase [Bacteroidota bacterium]